MLPTMNVREHQLGREWVNSVTQSHWSKRHMRTAELNCLNPEERFTVNCVIDALSGSGAL